MTPFKLWGLRLLAAGLFACACFGAGAWWSGDNAAKQARAAASASIAAAEQRARDATLEASRARLAAHQWEVEAARWEGRAGEARSAASRRYTQELNRVLSLNADAGDRCALAPEFAVLWNDAVQR